MYTDSGSLVALETEAAVVASDAGQACAHVRSLKHC